MRRPAPALRHAANDAGAENDIGAANDKTTKTENGFPRCEKPFDSETVRAERGLHAFCGYVYKNRDILPCFKNTDIYASNE